MANAEAIHYGLLIGLALGCELAPRSIFHRKNYFYPDNAKDYQISQYDEPLCRGGRLGDVRIHRVHLEEDAAKLVHAGASGRIHGAETSVVDFNRGGTPLVEIVTEPDVRSAEQAGEWLRLLRTTLRQLGVSDVNMEEGSLRCDANVSIRPVGTRELGHQDRAEEHELVPLHRARDPRRDRAAGGDRARRRRGRAGDAALRSAHGGDHARCAPRRRRTTTATSPSPTSSRSPSARRCSSAPAPRCPSCRRRAPSASSATSGLTTDSARLLAWRAELGDYFEAALSSNGIEAQPLANWVNELVARIDVEDPAESKVAPGALATLVELVSEKKVTQGAAKQVLDRLVAEGGDPAAIVEAEGLGAIGGGDALDPAVQAALDANPEIAERLRGGDMKPIGVIVGHVMRETRGRADGGEVTRIVREKLGL